LFQLKPIQRIQRLCGIRCWSEWGNCTGTEKGIPLFPAGEKVYARHSSDHHNRDENKRGHSKSHQCKQKEN